MTPSSMAVKITGYATGIREKSRNRKIPSAIRMPIRVKVNGVMSMPGNGTIPRRKAILASTGIPAARNRMMICCR